MSQGIKGVVFDVGYNLLDETRRWDEWAKWIKVTPEELWASLRAVIAEGLHHMEALRRLAPDFDLQSARAERARTGRRDEFLQDDLYPDVSPCIARLKAAGIKIGAAGNMPADVEHFLTSGGLGFDVLGSSERWGVEKPNPIFFERVIDAMQLPAGQLAYVGDRLDNDVRPAAAAGIDGGLPAARSVGGRSRWQNGACGGRRRDFLAIGVAGPPRSGPTFRGKPSPAEQQQEAQPGQ